MAYSDIKDPSAHFQAKIYTGTGASHNITNDGPSDLQPDWVWVKNRGTTNGQGYHHQTYDSSRGVTKKLLPSGNQAESTDTNSLTAFNSNGYTSGSNVGINESNVGHVAMQWKANGGTTSSNTDGDITSTVQANQDAGFSIVTYTGNTSNNQTVGHGLGVKPSVIIIRNRTRVEDWRLNHQSLNSGTGMIRLNSTDSYNTTGTTLMNVAPTSSVFNISTDWSVNGNYPFVAYCWAEKQGYSKFGSYIGNADANGPFVYTGFKPAWVMIKVNGTDDWYIFDHKRAGYNPEVFRLRANTTDAETTGTNNTVDHLSNGFKLRFTGGSLNGSGSTYFYMAFAENPFVTSTGVPTTAR
jgi:hypothetical protein